MALADRESRQTLACSDVSMKFYTSESMFMLLILGAYEHDAFINAASDSSLRTSSSDTAFAYHLTH
jgi:hypothetical protein